MSKKRVVYYGLYSPLTAAATTHSTKTATLKELVFNDWESVKPHIQGVSGAKVKKFPTFAEALLFSQSGIVPCFYPVNVLISVDLGTAAAAVGINLFSAAGQRKCATTSSCYRLDQSLLPNDTTDLHGMYLAGLMEAFHVLLKTAREGDRYWSKVNMYLLPSKMTWSAIGRAMKSGKSKQTRLWYSIAKNQIKSVAVVDWRPATLPDNFDANVQLLKLALTM